MHEWPGGSVAMSVHVVHKHCWGLISALHRIADIKLQLLAVGSLALGLTEFAEMHSRCHRGHHRVVERVAHG